MDINDAVKAAVAIKPAVVIPMHHLRSDPQEFKKKLFLHLWESLAGKAIWMLHRPFDGAFHG